MPQKTPEARAAYQKAYREKNAEKLRRDSAMWRAVNADALREAKHQDYLKNSEAYKARAKASRLRHIDEIRKRRSTPEFRKARNERRRAIYLLSHPPQKKTPRSRAQILQAKHEDYLRNKASYNERGRIYYAEHKEKWKDYWDSREYWKRKFARGMFKARCKGAEVIGVESLKDFYQQVFSKVAATCEYCRNEFAIKSITLDHKQPYALGGKHEVSNLAVACFSCNVSKGVTPFSKWRPQ